MSHRRYIMDSRHWRITNVCELPSFLRAANELVNDGILCIAEGSWRGHCLAVLIRLSSQRDESQVLGAGREFRVDLTSANATELAELAEKAAAPEIGLHYGLLKDGSLVLEWFDAMDDPISVVTSLPEAAVRRFATRVGGRVELVEGV